MPEPRDQISPPLHTSLTAPPREIAALTASLAGRYAIQREIGRGGMATVYLARDIRHNRSVALKVLNPELAAVLGVDRFLAEIQVTANLQHPNLLPLFDSGQAEGFLFYVMPYVEGESLRARLDREKQLPVDEAVRIATAVAGALDYAHRHDVIHRDLKPENILLHEGQPLVADFGIALAVSNAGGARITQTGLSLGTPQYMSPEQATGDRAIDCRADVYSLGAVLYEMLAGEPPHIGNTAQAIIARVLTEKPRDLRTVRASVQPQLDAAIAKALEKLPADRFDTAHDFATALTSRSAAIPMSLSRTPGRRVIGSAALITIGLLAAVALWGWLREIPTVDTAVQRSSIVLPDTAPLALIGDAPLGIGRPALAISDDGRLLAYVAQIGRTTKLALRPIDRFDVKVLEGTDGAYAPFFSPDGHWVGFFAGHELKKISVDGGDPIRLADAINSYGGTWDHDGRIYFAPGEGRTISSVSANGGETRVLLRAASENVPADAIIWPERLPDGDVLVALADGRIAVVSPATQTVRLLGSRGANPRYLRGGYAAFLNGKTLMGVRIDARRGEANEVSAVPLLEGVRSEATWGAAQMALSANGTLVYAAGGNGNVGTLGWADRAGGFQAAPFDTAVYGSFELSPDGHRVVVVRDGSIRGDVWVYDFDQHRQLRITTDGVNLFPIWNGDRAVLFGVQSGTRFEIRRKDLENAAPPSVVHSDTSVTGPTALSYDGRLLVLFAMTATTGMDVWLQRLAPPDTARPLFTGPTNDWGVQFSPDGKWIAYVSDRTGDYEVWVEPFPTTGQRWQISPSGGEEPRWLRSGDRLLYRKATSWLEVGVSTRAGFSFTPPREAFRGVYTNTVGPSYDVSPDGQRILVVRGREAPTVTRLNVVTNWTSEVAPLMDERKR